MPATLEWDKVARLDPASLQDCDKDEMDEVFGMFILVTVHTLHLTFLLSCPTTNACQVSNYKLSTVACVRPCLLAQRKSAVLLI